MQVVHNMQKIMHVQLINTYLAMAPKSTFHFCIHTFNIKYSRITLAFTKAPF